ncbi:MAG: ELWxxDGT repeat protein [Cyclobacteriaceae bacterium]
MKKSFTLLLAVCACIISYAQIQLLRDINLTSVSGSGSTPDHLVDVNGQLFFAATGAEGRELWKSNGTPGSTVLVKDINEGTNFSSPNRLTKVGELLFFEATDGVNGTELWRSDGTEQGTVMVKDIIPGPAGGGLSNFTDVNGTLFFIAFTESTGWELWVSDGSAGGTRLVKDISPGTNSSTPRFLTNVNGVLFFVADSPTYGAELWRSNGSEAGTAIVKDIVPNHLGSFPSDVINIDGMVFFTANDPFQGTTLWTSDGTELGTGIVKDIDTLSFGLVRSNFTNVNGLLYFTASDGIHGQELWRSDGSNWGTHMVKDINIGPSGSSQGNFTNFNGTLFFSASDGLTGRELWRSDGFFEGTEMVEDINPGAVSSNLVSFTMVGDNQLFFIANDGTSGNELWISYGLSAVMVKDILPGNANSNPQDLTDAGGVLYFAATDGVSGIELWSSTGTADGTNMVKDILAANASSSPDRFFDGNGIFYFTANDGVTGNELWKSDGTEEGTVLLADINTGTASSNPLNLTMFGGAVFFTASSSLGVELWKTDGTSQGTVLVKDIRPGGSSAPSLLTVVENTLFFSANDGINGIELWKSDGTSDGTVLVKNINGSSANSTPLNLTAVNGTLFFIAPTGPFTNTELWKSDGTPEGTVMVKDINPGSSSSNVANLTEAGGVLYFSATDESHGNELWRSDGSSDGTFMVKDIRPGSSVPNNLTDVNGTLFFAAITDAEGLELWKSDGTPGGTVLVKDVVLGPTSSNPSLLTAAGGTLFFRATLAETGSEIWKSDGTESGTVLVKDIRPGTQSSVAGPFQEVNGKVYFLASAGPYRSLWRSDGTECGTVMVTDNKFSIDQHLAVGSNHFFSGTAITTGREVYVMDAVTEPPDQCKLAQTISFPPVPPIMLSEESFLLTATSTSGLPVTYTISDPLVAGISDNTVLLLRGGTTIITASQTGNDDFHPAEDVQQFLIVNSIAIPSLDPLYCSGESLSIPFSITGIFGSQNVFTAELSDDSGEFGAPVVIGVVEWSNEETLSENGIIEAIIPEDAADGENYKIRIISTHPGGTGTPYDGTFIVDTDPEIISLAVTFDPTPINTPVSVSAETDDRNVVETVISWGDGSSTPGTFNGSILNDSHTYSTPGVYTVIVSMTDACGFSTSETHQYVVIYDPEGGFVTGSGWFLSPPGAYALNNQLTGRASFGFVAKYKNGSTIPEGKTDFEFRAADLIFESTSYEWLVVAGHKAMYRGVGELNDIPEYKFQISAVDGEKKSDATPDKFRIKIWDASGAVVYDNESGVSDDAEASTMIQAGAIKIVSGKSKSSTTSGTSFSNIVEKETSRMAYPNPFIDALTIYYSTEETLDVQVQLMDVTGVIAYQADYAVSSDGLYEISLRSANAQPGVYFLKIKQGSRTEYVKLLRQR